MRLLKFLLSEPEYILSSAIVWRVLSLFFSRLTPFTFGYSFYPRRLLLALTTRCTLRCKMCCLWGEEGLGKKVPPSFFQEELPVSVWQRLIEEVSFFKPSIILTGGEPLLYKDWETVVETAKRRGLRIFIATGGQTLYQNAENLQDLVDHLQVSLDGPSAEINDESRGVRGSFEKIIMGIKEIDRLKKEKKKKKPYINICYTISPINYRYLKEMIDFLKKLNLQINELAFQHLEWTNKEKITEHKKVFKDEFNQDTNFWSGFLYQPTNMKINILLEQIKDIKPSYSSIKNVVFRPHLKLSEIAEYYQTDKVPLRFRRKCLAPWNEAFILPSGEVWTCADYIGGNILQENFVKMWNNKKYRLLRIKLNKIKFFPICKTCASFYVY